VEDGTGGGKHNHFPLLLEADRAYEQGEIASETPTLLDPSRAGDTTLLYFNDEGRTEPRASEQAHPVHWSRAEKSIELYHLNHKDVVEERLGRFNTIKKLVNLANVCFDSWHAGNSAARASYDLVVGMLREMLQEQAEFSAAARDMVRGFRDDRHPWIDGIV
jgi:hypothetical protein